MRSTGLAAWAWAVAALAGCPGGRDGAPADPAAPAATVAPAQAPATAEEAVRRVAPAPDEGDAAEAAAAPDGGEGGTEAAPGAAPEEGAAPVGVPEETPLGSLTRVSSGGSGTVVMQQVDRERERPLYEVWRALRAARIAGDGAAVAALASRESLALWERLGRLAREADGPALQALPFRERFLVLELRLYAGPETLARLTPRQLVALSHRRPWDWQEPVDLGLTEFEGETARAGVWLGNTEPPGRVRFVREPEGWRVDLGALEPWAALDPFLAALPPSTPADAAIVSLAAKLGVPISPALWERPIGLDDPGPATGARPLFLWEVTSPAGRSWILGADTMAAETPLPLDPRTLLAWTDKEAVALQVWLQGFPEGGRIWHEGSLLPEGTTLRDVLPARTMKALAAAAQRLEAPLDEAMGLAPWRIAADLDVMEQGRLGRLRNYGLTDLFNGMTEAWRRPDPNGAVDAARRVEPLLTPGEDLAVLRDAPDKVRDGLLPDLLAVGPRGLAEGWRALDAARKAGDAEAWRRAFEATYCKRPAMKAACEREREVASATIATRLDALVRGAGGWFAVVDTARLLGDGGVLARLQAAGLAVRQLRSTLPVAAAAE